MCDGADVDFQVTGQWKGASAGGCGNYKDSYKHNPIYQFNLERAGPLLVELRGQRWVSHTHTHMHTHARAHTRTHTYMHLHHQCERCEHQVVDALSLLPSSRQYSVGFEVVTVSTVGEPGPAGFQKRASGDYRYTYTLARPLCPAVVEMGFPSTQL